MFGHVFNTATRFFFVNISLFGRGEGLQIAKKNGKDGPILLIANIPLSIVSVHVIPDSIQIGYIHYFLIDILKPPLKLCIVPKWPGYGAQV